MVLGFEVEEECHKMVYVQHEEELIFSIELLGIFFYRQRLEASPSDS